MNKVKIALSQLSIARLLQKSKDINAAMTGNTNFPSPPYTDVQMAAQIVLYENAMTAAADKSRVAMAKVQSEKKKLVNMLCKNAAYVNTAAEGNKEKLLTSGFDMYKTPEKHHLPQIINKIADFTNIPGTIDLKWQRSSHARYYKVFISEDNGITWNLFKTVFTRKLMVEALTSGKKYLFKVIPVNQQGEGPVSDITAQFAA
jgi:hypothetical protein